MRRYNTPPLLMVAYVVVLLVTVVMVMKFGPPKEEEAKKIGFITTGDMDTTGWGSENYQGIRTACSTLGMELLVRDHVPEYDGSCLQAVAELAGEGADMIILSSGGYSHEMEPYFDQYPQVSFYGAFANMNVPNLVGYSARMYQARYLSGIIAGMATKNGKIGFVSTTNIPEACRGINAFALGVRRVAPNAEVVVNWAGDDSTDEEDRAAARALVSEEHVDVITYHQGQHAVIEEAEDAGVASIGYYETASDVSELYLTCAACNWSVLYEQLIREHLRGQNRYVLSDWLGIDSGVVKLTEYSPLVSQEIQDEVSRAIDGLLDGQQVFSNEIYDNSGNLRCGEGEAMSDEYLIQSMDWLVEGVRVYE